MIRTKAMLISPPPQPCFAGVAARFDRRGGGRHVDDLDLDIAGRRLPRPNHAGDDSR